MIAILMPTYNHGNFITQSIEGVVSQLTNFTFKLFIVDDYSSDKNSQICQQFADAYPDKIVFSRNEKNLGANKTGEILREKGFSSKAKYLAICEGDDYWTDPYKLQKQVDFLEANEDYAICFSGYKILNEFENEEKIVVPMVGPILIEQLIKNNSFSTATVLFSAKYFKAIPEWFKKIPFGDWAIYLFILFNSKKKAYCIKDITAVYRIHAGGIHGNFHSSPKQLVVAYNMHIDFYKAIKKHLFNGAYSSLISECIAARKIIIADLEKKYKKPLPLILIKCYSFLKIGLGK